MNKKLQVLATSFLIFGLATPAYAFLQNLLNDLKKIQPGGAGSPTAVPVGQPSGGAAGSVDSMKLFQLNCSGILGTWTPLKRKSLSAAPEVVAGKYFKISADIEPKLLKGIGVNFKGSFLNLKVHIQDINDQTVIDLANAFSADPSVAMLAQVIAYAETGDGWSDGTKPSELTEAQTLLAMILMQYPELALDKNKAHELLRKSSLNNSGLGVALIARHYLYGDYAPRNIETFSNYIARASKNYPVKLADQSIYFALDTIPNWQYRKQYLDLINMSQDMTRDIERQRRVAKSTNLYKNVLALMAEGHEIDELMLKSLGGGDKIAEIRAKGEMLRKEGTGESNLIEVAANQSALFKSEVKLLLAMPHQLDSQNKENLAKANRLILKNMDTFRGYVAELSLKVFSGDIGAAVEVGQHFRTYIRSACEIAPRSVELAKQVGIPLPQIPASEMAKDL